jgi:hypothetical protein
MGAAGILFPIISVSSFLRVKGGSFDFGHEQRDREFLPTPKPSGKIGEIVSGRTRLKLRAAQRVADQSNEEGARGSAAARRLNCQQ